MSSCVGVGVCLRGIGSPLFAFHRMDVINGCGTMSLLVQLCLFWLGFRLGLGIYSMALAQIPVILFTLIVYGWTCYRNGYYPKRGCWGKPSWSAFKQVFFFGKDVLFISIGAQLINGTQLLIINNFLGLDAAAVFSVMTKLYNLAMQLVLNLVSSASSSLTEIFVRQDLPLFRKRYWDLITLTLAMSTIVASCIAAGNSAFVTLWTTGKISWAWQCDLILAATIILKNLNGCLVGLFGQIKCWKPVRMLYLGEGVAFVLLAILDGPRVGPDRSPARFGGRGGGGHHLVFLSFRHPNHRRQPLAAKTTCSSRRIHGAGWRGHGGLRSIPTGGLSAAGRDLRGSGDRAGLCLARSPRRSAPTRSPGLAPE